MQHAWNRQSAPGIVLVGGCKRVVGRRLGERESRKRLPVEAARCLLQVSHELFAAHARRVILGRCVRRTRQKRGRRESAKHFDSVEFEKCLRVHRARRSDKRSDGARFSLGTPYFAGDPLDISRPPRSHSSLIAPDCSAPTCAMAVRSVLCAVCHCKRRIGASHDWLLEICGARGPD